MADLPDADAVFNGIKQRHKELKIDEKLIGKAKSQLADYSRTVSVSGIHVSLFLNFVCIDLTFLFH